MSRADVEHVRLGRGTGSARRAARCRSACRPCARAASRARPARRRARGRAARRIARLSLGRVGDHALRAEHLLARVAAHRLVGRVDVDDAEVGVAQHQRVGGGVEDRAVLLLARAQRLVGELALGDVAPDVRARAGVPGAGSARRASRCRSARRSCAARAPRTSPSRRRARARCNPRTCSFSASGLIGELVACRPLPRACSRSSPRRPG